MRYLTYILIGVISLILVAPSTGLAKDWGSPAEKGDFWEADVLGIDQNFDPKHVRELDDLECSPTDTNVGDPATVFPCDTTVGGKDARVLLHWVPYGTMAGSHNIAHQRLQRVEIIIREDHSYRFFERVKYAVSTEFTPDQRTENPSHDDWSAVEEWADNEKVVTVGRDLDSDGDPVLKIDVLFYRVADSDEPDTHFESYLEEGDREKYDEWFDDGEAK